MCQRGAVAPNDGECKVCELFLNRYSKRRKYQQYDLKRKGVNKNFCLWPSVLLSPLFLSEEAAGEGEGDGISLKYSSFLEDIKSKCRKNVQFFFFYIFASENSKKRWFVVVGF